MAEDKKIPFLVETGRGFSVNWMGRYLYSSRDPLSSVLRRISSLNLEDNTLYLIPSPLLCYGFDELIKKMPASSFLLGLERFQELMALVQNHIPPTLLDVKNCQIIRSENSDQILQFIESLGTYRFRKCLSIHLTGGYNLDKGFYDKIEEIINRYIFKKWQIKASLMKMGPLWFSNIFKNRKFFSSDLSLDEIRIDGPLMLCGAGESLELAIPLIKELRKHIFLVAVDTAYPALLAHDIEPDGVFNLDGQFYNYYDFYRHGNKELYLFSDITAFPASLRLPGMKNVFFSSQFIPNHLLKRLDDNCLLPTSIAPMGSVGVTSLYLCRILSQKKLILAGLDFSYTPGKSHAKGTIYHDLYLMKTNRINPDGGLTSLSYTRPRHFLKGQLTGRLLKSDTILEAYYRNFCDIISLQKDGIYMMDGDYPTLGVPLFRESVINAMKRETCHVTIIPKKKSFSSYQSFAEKEKSLLQAVMDGWNIYSESGDSESLETALSHCNYLTIPMNDDLRDPAFYTQTVKWARNYLNLLSKVDMDYHGKNSHPFLV